MKEALQIKYLLIFSLIFSVLGCQMQQEVKVELPAHQQEMVVECYLEPGEPFRALVTYTTSFYEETIVSVVDTAEVQISSTEKTRTLYAINSIDSSYNKIFNYWYPDEVLHEEGKEYQIRIVMNGEVKASAKTRFLPKADIMKIEQHLGEDSLAALKVHIKDQPEEENYYRVMMRGTNPKAGYTYDGIWSDEEASNGTLVATTPYRFKQGWSNVVVNLYHIDKEFYEFLKSIQQARESNYNPFMQPASIKSTVDGATGVFAAISLTSDTIAIK